MNHAIHLLKKEQDRLKGLPSPTDNKEWVEREQFVNDIELVLRLYKRYIAEEDVRSLGDEPWRVGGC